MESVTNFLRRIYDRVDAFARANPRRTQIIVGVVVLLLLSAFVRVPPPHISLAGEGILANGPSWFTNSLFTTFIVDIVLLVLTFWATRKVSLIPGGMQNIMEAIVEYLYDLAESVAGKAGSVYFPWAATIFLLVLISNWFDVLPFVGSVYVEHSGEQATQAQEHSVIADQQLAMVDGKLTLVESAAVNAQQEAAAHVERVPLLRPPSADLSMTLALALGTMVMAQYYGVKALGGSYFRKFWNTSGDGFAQKAINLFVSILEAISEFSRLLTLTFRLFGNIFAGEVVLTTMAFLVAFLVPLPFFALEVLVGVIQAFVFTILSLMYFSMATVGHGHAEEHH